MEEGGGSRTRFGDSGGGEALRDTADLLSLLRRSVERFPALAATYRYARDRLALQAAVAQDTPFGFRLAGSKDAARGQFEPEETAFLAAILQRGDVFVDVGANVGFYTCLAASKGAHVVAIEPLSENLAYLYRNITENGFGDVEVFPLGVSDTPGLLSLYGGGTGASMLAGWAGATEAYRRTVATTTLDIVLSNRFSGRHLVIKVDVEGAELPVLRGAVSVLRAAPRPSWLVEIVLTENQPSGINAHFEQTFEMFWSHGYSAYTADKEAKPVLPEDVRGWVSQRRRSFGGYNYLFR
jgi:FkbM family methyltransferase